MLEAPQISTVAGRTLGWVGKTYVVLLAVCAVWIVAGGCSFSVKPQIEPARRVIHAGEQVALTLTDGRGRPYSFPKGAIWEVNGVPGGSPFYGQVDAGGNYVAPAELTAPSSFTVRLVRPREKEPEVIAALEIDVLPAPADAS